MTADSYGWPNALVAGAPVWMDASYQELVKQHPALDAMSRYLPDPPASEIFKGQQQINALRSSYATRGYGALLYALARTIAPRSIVEIGIMQGYSLLSLAAALRDNGAGHVTGYDLFDAYPYRHAERDQVLSNVKACDLDQWVTIQPADVFGVHEQWSSVDVLHVDVSNDGDTYRRVCEQWAGKVRQVILLEGGSADRDSVEWMRRYTKPAIASAVCDLRRLYPGWTFTVLTPFPSMTVACNRAAFATRARA